MYRVIKPGKPQPAPKQPMLSGTCKRCGCEFECSVAETSRACGTRCTACPNRNCGEIVAVYPECELEPA